MDATNAFSDKTTVEYNQPLVKRVSCINYSNDCLLVGKPFLVLCSLVKEWVAAIMRACATWVVPDLVHQHLVLGKNLLSCKQAKS